MGLLNDYIEQVKADRVKQAQAISRTYSNHQRRYSNTRQKIASLDPIAVYGRCGITLKRGGKQWQLVKCAFHDDTKPSMSVNVTHGGYHCFACGAKGNLMGFYMEYKGIDFKTACRELNI